MCRRVACAPAVPVVMCVVHAQRGGRVGCLARRMHRCCVMFSRTTCDPCVAILSRAAPLSSSGHRHSRHQTFLAHYRSCSLASQPFIASSTHAATHVPSSIPPLLRRELDKAEAISLDDSTTLPNLTSATHSRSTSCTPLARHHVDQRQPVSGQTHPASRFHSPCNPVVEVAIASPSFLLVPQSGCNLRGGPR